MVERQEATRGERNSVTFVICIDKYVVRFRDAFSHSFSLSLSTSEGYFATTLSALATQARAFASRVSVAAARHPKGVRSPPPVSVATRRDRTLRARAEPRCRRRHRRPSASSCLVLPRGRVS